MRQTSHTKFEIKTRTHTLLVSINRLTPNQQEAKMCHQHEEAKKMSAGVWDGYQCGFCGDAFKKEEELNEHIRGECTYPNKY